MRPIGKHFVAAVTITGVNIVKPSSGEVLPLDEPLFLFRGRDRLALPALLKFREICVADGCNDYMLGGLDEVIEEFRRFTVEHADRMKQPGVTRGL